MRCVNERTLNLCVKSLSSQIAQENIKVIQNVPFEKNLLVMMQLALKENLKWTIAIDADTILHASAVAELEKSMESQNPNTFTLQGYIYDNYFRDYRPAGHRIYRTELFEKSVRIFDPTIRDTRPETRMIDQMKLIGYGSVLVRKVFGLHGFNQYYEDIYRTGYLHGVKHSYRIYEIIHLAGTQQNIDEDFKVFFIGYMNGFAKTIGDSSQLPDGSRDKSKDNLIQNFTEKNAIADQDIDKLILESYSLINQIQKEYPLYNKNKYGIFKDYLTRFGLINSAFILFRQRQMLKRDLIE